MKRMILEIPVIERPQVIFFPNGIELDRSVDAFHHQRNELSSFESQFKDFATHSLSSAHVVNPILEWFREGRKNHLLRILCEMYLFPGLFVLLQLRNLVWSNLISYLT